MVKRTTPTTNGRNGRSQTARKPTTNRSNRTQAISARTTNMPVSTAMRNSRPVRNSPSIFSGSDFLSKITVVKAPADASDRIIFSINISPSSFLGTRLTQLSPLWERYRFTNLSFRYVPAVPTTLACQLVGYMDTDPLDDPSIIRNADSLVRQAVAQTGSQQWNFIAPHRIPLAQRSDDQMYYTGEEKQNERFSSQGKFFLIQVTNPININGAPIDGPTLECGSLFVDWTIKFVTPQINPEGVESLPSTTTVPVSAVTRALLPSSGSMAPGLLIFGGLKPNARYLVTLSATQDIPPAGALPTAITSIYPTLPTATVLNEPVRLQGSGGIYLKGTIDNIQIGATPDFPSSSAEDLSGAILARTGPTGEFKLLVTDLDSYDTLVNWFASVVYRLTRLLV